MYIDKRDLSYNSWGSNSNAKWAFFAVFVVGIIIVILGTMTVNKRRSKRGMQPIYGTRWITPPSYFQSQNQYNQGQREGDTNFVPEYTERANENDMGYYDNTGTFVPNPNAKSSVPMTAMPEAPQQSHQRQYSVTSGHVPAQTIDDEDLYRRPGHAPPLHEEDQHSVGNTRTNSSNEFAPPSNPPPHLQEGSTSETTTNKSTTSDDVGAPAHPPPNLHGSSSSDDYERPPAPPQGR